MKLQLGRFSRMQISRVLMLTLLSVTPGAMSAQNATPPKSPDEVLRSYRKMDAAGERLTARGWYRASSFFVKPHQPPQYKYKVVAVMDGERVDLPRIKGNRAEAQVLCSAVGQIDSSGRFTFAVGPSLLDGHAMKQPVAPFLHGPSAPLARIYDLVLTDTHWEFGPKGDDPKEVKGLPEWRIENFEMEPWVTVEVALRYLTKLRDESSSEIIKKNAEKSIAVLRRLP